MMIEKVTYKCKCCGWQKQIAATWADVNPRFCGNSSCDYSAKKGKGKRSFKSNPDMLEKKMPEKPKPVLKSEAPKSAKSKVRKKK